jgi:hypothetical protein
MSEGVKRFGKIERDDDGGATRVVCTVEECGFGYDVEEAERTSLDVLFGEEGGALRIFALLMEHGLDVHGIGVGEEIVQ